MSDTITLTGIVATVPRHLVTGEGLPITSFRMASTQRRYDRAQQKWIDGDTNWFTVTSFRQLALNVAPSLQKGQRVLVAGRLRIRDWEAGERSGTNVEIDADAIGHDLSWGTASFTRSTTVVVAEAEAGAEASGDAASEGWATREVPAGPADSAEDSSPAAVLADDTIPVPF
ncbi:MAG TPA: single-stranded DNA-binding protein [Pseudolysinimonas sp.]|nr:single-stranded DNA-binding protein [Pseudolysinimonas sp.]